MERRHMRAGKLDRQIVIQRFTNTVDDYGTPVETWTTVATVRAQIIQQSTEEFIRGYGATDDAIVIFRVRWIDGITTADRVVFDSENYNIKELKPIGRAKGLEFRCQKMT
jgi:SPP1 family predicted phage head-tail adaptor